MKAEPFLLIVRPKIKERPKTELCLADGPHNSALGCWNLGYEDTPPTWRLARVHRSAREAPTMHFRLSGLRLAEASLVSASPRLFRWFGWWVRRGFRIYPVEPGVQIRIQTTKEGKPDDMLSSNFLSGLAPKEQTNLVVCH